MHVVITSVICLTTATTILLCLHYISQIELSVGLVAGTFTSILLVGFGIDGICHAYKCGRPIQFASTRYDPIRQPVDNTPGSPRIMGSGDESSSREDEYSSGDDVIRIVQIPGQVDALEMISQRELVLNQDDESNEMEHFTNHTEEGGNAAGEDGLAKEEDKGKEKDTAMEGDLGKKDDAEVEVAGEQVLTVNT